MREGAAKNNGSSAPAQKTSARKSDPNERTYGSIEAFARNAIAVDESGADRVDSIWQYIQYGCSISLFALYDP